MQRYITHGQTHYTPLTGLHPHDLTLWRVTGDCSNTFIHMVLDASTIMVRVTGDCSKTFIHMVLDASTIMVSVTGDCSITFIQLVFHGESTLSSEVDWQLFYYLHSWYFMVTVLLPSYSWYFMVTYYLHTAGISW